MTPIPTPQDDPEEFLRGLAAFRLARAELLPGGPWYVGNSGTEVWAADSSTVADVFGDNGPLVADHIAAEASPDRVRRDAELWLGVLEMSHGDLCSYGPPLECDCPRGAMLRLVMPAATEYLRGLENWPEIEEGEPA